MEKMAVRPAAPGVSPGRPGLPAWSGISPGELQELERLFNVSKE
jgi:hypothetical protein